VNRLFQLKLAGRGLWQRIEEPRACAQVRAKALKLFEDGGKVNLTAVCWSR
jgi:hypothetical protein